MISAKFAGFSSEGTDHLGMENGYDVWQDLGATYQPHFILLDANGRVVASWAGGGDAGVWEGMLAKLP